MTQIVAAAGGGEFTTGSSWVGGVAPTAADDAVLNATSGNITIDGDAVCRSLDCNGYTGTLSGTGSLTIGDATAGANNIALRLSAGMTYSFTPLAQTISFVSTSATQQSIISAGKALGGVTLNGSGGNWVLGDALNTGVSNFSYTRGTFSDGGFGITCFTFNGNNSNARNLTLTGTVTCASSFSLGATNLTASLGSSTIILSANAGATFFIGAGQTYGEVRFGTGNTGSPTISGSNTFTKLSVSGGSTKTIKITAGTTQTLTGGSDAFFSGAPSNLITIESTSAGSAWNLSKAADIIDSDYISLKDSHAAGGATFYAGSHSTNVSGNTGWSFTDAPSGPTVSSCDPATGTIHGGTSVTLTGTGFTGSTAAALGGAALTSFSVVNDTTITGVTAAHAEGLVDVVVSHPDGDGTLANGFTYETPAPTLSSIDPASGTTAGGTSVTLTGVDLTGTSGVTFGGDAATDVTVVNDTTVTCTTPAHAAGAVDVVLTTGAGSDTLVGGFTYEDVTAPTASSWATNVDGDEITATLSEAGCTPASGTGGFTLGGTGATVASWAISGTTLTLTLNGTVYSGQTVTISYNDATASEAIADSASNLLADISGASVTNNSTAEPPPTTSGSTFSNCVLLVNSFSG